MGQVIAVISGKGGTGKTSLTAGVAACLAAEGQKVLCIDCDMGLRNLDLSLGLADEATVAFTDVMDGLYTLEDAVTHPRIPGLDLLTAPVTKLPEDVDQEAFGRLLEEVRTQYDWCLIDAPAGVGVGFQLATRYADELVVVAVADPASMRDAARAADLIELQDRPDRPMRLVVNRVSRRMYRKLRATVDDVMDGVGLPLLGIVPDDISVTLAAAASEPLILYTSRGASVACLHIARRLCGRRATLLRL
ncbi:MAG TPA: AAA family ATPase [Candidatus Avoscillospira avistercoris]|uniref:AAA family ATPase n=1 Tax=Candidatus Avoscillospira avistercoris TaxID=2840707 RepID=A0A9D1JTH2_9FIRM|nr:AAA family ATPase [Candidatus Avoscillospira avistercoris]